MLNYLKLFRIPLVFTAVADSAAGYLFVRGLGRKEIDWGTMGFLAAASAGLYMFGMAMNDIADKKRDRVIAPGRVLPSGRLSVRAALTASFVVLAVSLGATLLTPREHLPWTLGLWGSLVVFILLYDFLLKIPPAMGVIRGLDVLLGAAAAGAAADPERLRWAAMLAGPALVYVTALTFVSTLEEGYVRRGVVFAGAAAMTVGAAAPGLIRILLGQEVFIGGWAMSLWLAARVWQRAIPAKTPERVMTLVRDGVAGIIFLDAAILFSAKLVTQGLGVALLIGPAMLSVALFKRRA